VGLSDPGPQLRGPEVDPFGTEAHPFGPELDLSTRKWGVPVQRRTSRLRSGAFRGGTGPLRSSGGLLDPEVGRSEAEVEPSGPKADLAHAEASPCGWAVSPSDLGATRT